MNRYLHFLLICIFLLHTFTLTAQHANDTLSLDTVMVRANGWIQSVRINGGGIHLNKNLLEALPLFAGEADYLRSLQLFPNISSNNEYDTSLHVQGSENHHNNIQIAGAPIYQVGHLLGLFSSFNTTHYQSVRLTSNPSHSYFGNHLGASVEINPPAEVAAKFSGELNVSPFASSSTIRCPLTHTSSLTLSARVTYLDLIYSSWLKNEEDQMRYNFNDINASFVSSRGNDQFFLDLYMTHDKFGMQSEAQFYKMTTYWNNLALSGRWKHHWNHVELEQTLLYSTFNNNLHFLYGGAQLNTPSSIATWGYKSQINIGRFIGGIDYFGHLLSPQSAAGLRRIEHEQKAHEFSEYIEYETRAVQWQISAGVRASQFINPDHQVRWFLDPCVRISFSPHDKLKIHLSAYHKHQFLFRSGLSSIGLPIEFWFSSDSALNSQTALGASVNIDWLLAQGDYTLSAELFYRKLRNTCEYLGDLFELWAENYNWKSHIIQGKGRDYGLGIIGHKRTGKLTGWVSYSLSRSRRTFNTPQLQGQFPSSHDRPHELNVAASYRISPKWTLSSVFILASGTPFTAPKQFYIVNGSIVSQYGELNANRLPCYKRLDLSANYEVKKKSYSYNINITLYNALYLPKPIYYRLKFYKGDYGYRGLGFFTRILPSVSFNLKF